jgi:hypothetical protein
MKTKTRFAAALVCALALTIPIARAADPLPSWNDSPARQSTISFVEKVTKPGSADFVPLPERIATFDNAGTLWCEKPMPVQLFFVLDRVKALAPIDRLATLTSLVPRVEFGDEEGVEVFYNIAVTRRVPGVGGLRTSVSF